MRKLYSIIFLSIFIASCAPKLKKNGRYSTSLKAEVTHKVSRDLNSYNMLFVPPLMAEFGKDIGYFNSVMTHNQVDLLLDLEPNDTVNHRELSDALREEGLNDKYLVLEEVRVHSLRNMHQWNLTDPVNNEVLFSSRIQLNQNSIVAAFGAVGNSLIDYLDENSQKVSGKIKEERIFPEMKFGYNMIVSVVNPSTNAQLKSGIGLSIFGEYRFSKPLALQLGFNGSWTDQNQYSDTSTMILAAPLHLKWYLTNSFDIHAGPQLNYITDPEAFSLNGKNLINEKKLGWDMSFGIGYNWGDVLVVNFDYTKGISELGKVTRGGVEGPSLKLETFTLGLGIKF